MTKFKKLLINGAALLALTAPVISISCGKEGSVSASGETFTQEEKNGSEINGSTLGDRILNNETPNMSSIEPYTITVGDKILIGHTFSDGGVQQKALAALVEKYNTEVAPKLKGSLPVGLKRLGSGYSAGKDIVTKGLSSKQTSDFMNLILNYSTVASELAKAKMLLSFNDNLKSASTDLSQFSEKFITSNFQTENIDLPSTWILPAFKSTTIFSINAPVLSYILDTLVEKGMEVAEDFQEEYNNIKAKGQGDRAGVKKIWGEPVANVETIVNEYKGTGGNVKKLSKAIFNSYAELLDFAAMAQKLFVNSAATNSTIHVFGVDDYTALYNQALYSALLKEQVDAAKLAGTKLTQEDALKQASAAMIESVSRNGGKLSINYDVLKKQSTSAYVKTQEIFNKTKAAIETGGLKIYPGGQYSSNDQTKHYMAFSIGSTAGYSHNYVSGESSNLINSLNKGASLKIDEKGSSLKLSENKSTPGLVLLSKLESGKLAFGKYKNAIHSASEATFPDGKSANYELQFVNAAEETTFTSALTDDALPKASLIIINKDGSDKIIEKAKAQNVPVAELKKKNDTRYYGILLLDSVDNKSLKNTDQALVAKLTAMGYTIKVTSALELLGKEELISQPVPLRWTSEDPYNVVYVQGPSMIGVHTTEAGDLATKLFVNWLMTSETTYERFTIQGNDGKEEVIAENLTPRDMFQSAMGYILPYKGFEKNTDFPTKGKLNPYLKTAFELFSNVAKSTDADEVPYVTFEEPGAIFADSFRSGVQGAWDSLQAGIDSNKADSSHAKPTFEDFIRNATVK
ncbi:P68 family surface lipoprotein [Mycoplasma sp. 21DD0573]|uniref:P68 family surface lipoprotein n=1 Tax=unclassified Mycoplasma TaxID=2683645 RepID=UPI002B1E6940|nr:P80 family lipoprotein [Mycoplasma sp. 21DD0573]MEA4276213.1 P80 family lipoprotein [Mycoplasma sp. 21DD0573]